MFTINGKDATLKLPALLWQIKIYFTLKISRIRINPIMCNELITNHSCHNVQKICGKNLIHKHSVFMCIEQCNCTYEYVRAYNSNVSRRGRIYVEENPSSFPTDSSLNFDSIQWQRQAGFFKKNDPVMKQIRSGRSGCGYFLYQWSE
jgi:hypothetical protein